jgi:protein-disulfide isomerase
MSSIEGDEGDLTRKQRREQARAERKAVEEAAAASAARRTRLTQLGVVVGVVVAAIVVVLIATSGGSKSGAPKTGTEKNATVKEISTLIDGIPQSGNTLGSPTAPVTLQYYGDLECPICREFTVGALPTVIANLVRSGKVKVEYHSMETATREPGVFREQQAAALAAGRQNLMWYFVELFYHEQGEEDSGYVTPAFLKGIATQVPGLNVAKWEAERSNPKLVEQVERDETKAGEEGFNGTPSFLVGKTGGPTQKLTEFTSAELDEASALFEPTLEKLAKS